MALHTQAVDTRPSFSSHAAWVRGYSKSPYTPKTHLTHSERESGSTALRHTKKQGMEEEWKLETEIRNRTKKKKMKARPFSCCGLSRLTTACFRFCTDFELNLAFQNISKCRERILC